MITFEALDVILRVQNLSTFQAKMRAGMYSVRQIGRAARGESAAVGTAIYGAARKATLGLTGLAAAAAVVGFNQSVEFQKQMTLVNTQAGATKSEVAGLKGQVLDLAKTLPQGPVALAKGLYHIESIGIRGSNAMRALKVAAQGAAVGNASLEETTTALGAAWLAGIKGAGGFRHTMAVMNATVGAGNMRMDELVTALGTGVLPTAKLAGLGIQDVMGALALLKDEGYGAYGAMAQFATALHFFTDPTDKATKALKRLGISQLEISDMMRKKGLVPTLKLLRDHLHLTGEQLAAASKKNWAPKTFEEQLLGDILPGGRGRVFRVLLNQADRYQMKLDQINRTSGRFNNAVQTTQATSAFKLHRAWSRLQVALIQLGDVIRGPGTDAIDFLIGLLTQFVTLLSHIPDYIQAVIDTWNGLPGIVKATIAVLAITAGQFLALFAVMRGVAMIVEAWRAFRFAILAVRGAMILLSMGSGPIMFAVMLALSILILLVIKHWKWFKQAALDAWHWIKNAAVDVYHWLLKHWQVAILAGPIGLAAILIIKHWKQIKHAGIDAAHWIVRAWHNVTGAIKDTVHWLKNAQKNYENFLGTKGHDPIADALGYSKLRHFLGLGHPHRAIGGPVMAGVPYMTGERGPEIFTPGTRGYITPMSSGNPSLNSPRSTQPGGGPAYDRPVEEHIHVHAYMDGKEVTEVVSRRLANRRARR